MTAFTLGEASARALARVGGGLLRAPAIDRMAGRVAGDASHRTVSGEAWRRTGGPVLRGSAEAGTFEDGFFTVPAKGEPDRLLHAARRALDAGRRLRREARSAGRVLTVTERMLAGLTAGAVRVYEEICTLARLNRGRVFPSYDWLAEATGLGRATVARALHVLERIGFLVRRRRFTRIAATGGAPRYRQTSNAYRAVLPPHVLGYLPRWLRPAPIPVDQQQQDARRKGERAEMLAGLSCHDLATATIGGALGRILAKLGAGIDRRETPAQCESQNDPKPPRDSSYKHLGS